MRSVLLLSVIAVLLFIVDWYGKEWILQELTKQNLRSKREEEIVGENVSPLQSKKNALSISPMSPSKDSWAVSAVPVNLTTTDTSVVVSRESANIVSISSLPSLNSTVSISTYNDSMDWMAPPWNTKCDINDRNRMPTFSELGNVKVNGCSTPLSVFGVGDDAKRVCMDDIVLNEPCHVVSIGSNNQWGFEEAIFAKTHCKVETFDCTGDFVVPKAIRSRVRWHKKCISDKQDDDLYLDWPGVIALLGGAAPILLKMDIEGWEWPVLKQVAAHSVKPHQIAVEIHACTYFLPEHFPIPPYKEVLGDVGKAKHYYGGKARYAKIPHNELQAVMRSLVTSLGDMDLIHRNDQTVCKHCSEILLRKQKKR